MAFPCTVCWVRGKLLLPTETPTFCSPDPEAGKELNARSPVTTLVCQTAALHTVPLAGHHQSTADTVVQDKC